MDKLIYQVKRSQVSPSYIEEYREKYEQIQYQDPIDYKNNSRYSSLRTYIDKATGRTIHETWVQRILRYSNQDQYFSVTKSEENRLDIISNYYYYTGRYWWVIALANYLFDPFDVPVGTYLRIPSIESLYGEGGVLRG